MLVLVSSSFELHETAQSHYYVTVEIEGRKERYIRVVISERGTGISFNAMQYFSKYKNTKVKNTRDDVAEADGGEGDEAEVEGVKEGPVIVEPNDNVKAIDYDLLYQCRF